MSNDGKGTDRLVASADSHILRVGPADCEVVPADGDILQSQDSPPLEVTVEALAREGESRSGCWERLRKEARAAGLPRGQGPGTAYEWATEHVDRLFIKPPIPDPPVVSIEPSGPIGLADLPSDWPTLPSNASLASEISWVQANRLRVVKGDIVDLTQSLSPAPSHAAIGWLETSIRAYSKYCDIAARATAQQQDEQEHIRRERLSIEEVRALLLETIEAST